MQHQRYVQPLPDAADQFDIEYRRSGIDAVRRANAHGKAGNPCFPFKALGFIRVGIAGIRSHKILFLAADAAHLPLHRDAVRGAHLHHFARQRNILLQRQRAFVNHHTGIARA